MADQKADSLLNMALGTPEKEREKSGDLNLGFDAATRTWELIVTYSGDLETALKERFPQVFFRGLLGNFAILRVPEGQVSEVIALTEIEYAEQPKRLYFAVNQAKAASCILPLQDHGRRRTGIPGLSGKGVLVAVIDSGIDYFHEDFRDPDGGTRILYLYDQVSGTVFDRRRINEALAAESPGMGASALAAGGPETAEVADVAKSPDTADGMAPPRDVNGHGTAVAAIAAGNGRENGGLYRGVAYESELVIVRLGAADPDGFPHTTQLMIGVDFAVRTALKLGRPLALNLSFGNACGSHDGNGILERYLDSAAEMGRSVFVIGTGNEGDSGGHASGTIPGSGEISVDLAVSDYEIGFCLQLWKNYEDEMEIFLTDPSKTVREQVSPRRGPYTLSLRGTDVRIFYGEPGPFNIAQEIFFDFIPRRDYVESGIWQIVLKGRVGARYDLWLPSSGAVNRTTEFLRPSPDTTLTIPSTALRPVSVGAYDDSSMAYAPFSGRGDTRAYRIQKPDLVAPGVGIITAANGGGYAPVTGTSFAAPFVTGTAALLMEWGIVRGNDPYLYGDKVKAYLRKGAKPLPAFSEYPNPQTGYGALCAAKSLPDQGTGGLN